MPRRLLGVVCLLLCLAPEVRSQTAPAFQDSGFVLETVATLPAYEPVGMTWDPDGAMFVWQENGVVRVVKDGKLLPEPFLDLRPKVNTVNDRGLLGLALDPDFRTNGYVYLLYTYDENGVPGDPAPKTSRLSRVTADPSNRYVALQGSETVLLGKAGKGPCAAGSDCIGADGDSHSVGTLRFGKDGKLYVSFGDGASYTYVDTLALRSQDLDRYEGKILRINRDGSAPGDNPFDDGTQSVRSKIYAYGLRNPYRFAIDPASGALYIGDVGWNKYEEINTGRGANFGWPCYEGPGPQKEYQNRFAACRALPKDSVTFGVHAYDHTVGTAVIGGAFAASKLYPSQYQGNYFFADYTKHTLFRMPFDAAQKPLAPVPFLTQAQGPVSVELGPDGLLYYLSLPTGEIRRLRPATGDPIAKAAADTLSGAAPLEVAFSAAGSRDPGGLPLTYRWDFGDGDTSSAASPTHTFAPLSTRGFTVRLTVTNSLGKAATDTLAITVGSTRPRANILSPLPGLQVRPGDTLRYSGTAVDSEETLPAEALSWTLLLHHDDHFHPYGVTTGAKGSLVVEDHGDKGTYSYELLLIATDRTGLQDTQKVSVGILIPQNTPPKVLAGADTSLTLGSPLVLQGGISDDGRPKQPGALKVLWSLVDGPAGGKAVFAHADSVGTRVEFDMPGVYRLCLSASDGEFERMDTLRVDVRAPKAAPRVIAGKDAVVAFDSALALAGSIAFDSATTTPSAVRTAWFLRHGPAGAKVTFEDSSDLETRVAFSQAGDFVLCLKASGGDLEAEDSLRVTVLPPAPVALSGSRPNGNWLVRLGLREDEAYDLRLLDARGKPVFRARGRGAGLADRVAEALGQRRGRQVYVLRVVPEGKRGMVAVVLYPGTLPAGDTGF
jgi:glucose/arabinose dehydrogenase/PKD repeat protein